MHRALTAGPRAAAESSWDAEGDAAARRARSLVRPNPSPDAPKGESSDQARRLRVLALDGDPVEIDHAARALCWAIHRDLAWAALLRVAPITRRMHRSDVVAHRIPGGGPGSPRG